MRIVQDHKAVELDLRRRVDLATDVSSRSKAAGIVLLKQALMYHTLQDDAFLVDLRSSESTLEHLMKALDASALATPTQEHLEGQKQLEEVMRLFEHILRRAQSNSQAYRFRWGLWLQFGEA